jgi:molecular chaperone DnaK (HSP70)
MGYTIGNMFTNQAKLEYYPPDGTEQTYELLPRVIFEKKETTFLLILEIKIVIRNAKIELMATSSTEFHYTFDKSTYPNIYDLTSPLIHTLIKKEFHRQYYHTLNAINDDIREKGFETVEMCSGEDENKYIQRLISDTYKN